MRFFIDTGSVAEVEEIAAWGILSGATTNPTLLAKEEGDPGDIIRRICDLVGGPVSAEVVSDDAAGMVEEGRALAALHEHVVVKVPFSSEGLAATRALVRRGHPGEHDARVLRQPGAAVGAGGRDLRVLLHGPARRHLGRLRPRWWRRSSRRCGPGGTTTEVLAASIRHPEHVVTAARLGCEVATVPAKVFRQMLNHPLTEKGRELLQGRLGVPARVRRVAA